MPIAVLAGRGKKTPGLPQLLCMCSGPAVRGAAASITTSDISGPR